MKGKFESLPFQFIHPLVIRLSLVRWAFFLYFDFFINGVNRLTRVITLFCSNIEVWMIR
jgi:hypothetical protein